VRGRDGTLPRGRLRAVLEYIEEHLDAAPRAQRGLRLIDPAMAARPMHLLDDRKLVKELL
jgi:hypothetical protein